MKKRTLALLLSLALLLMLGLVAFADDLEDVLSGNAETTAEAPEDEATEAAPAEEEAEEPAEAPAEEPEDAEEPAEAPEEKPAEEPAQGATFAFSKNLSDMTASETNRLYDRWYAMVSENFEFRYAEDADKILEVENVGDKTGSLTIYIAYLTWDSVIVKDEVQTVEIAPGETGSFTYDDSYQWAYIDVAAATYGDQSIELPGQLDILATPADPDAEKASEIPVDPTDFVSQASFHKYGKKNLVIVEVLNEGDVNSKVTVTGTYLDEDGNVIDTETQTFDGFSAGWKNSFVFNPGYAFASFTYTVTAVETDFISTAEDVEVVWVNEASWNGPYAEWASDDSLGIASAYHRSADSNGYDPVVDLDYDVLVLDANGDVIGFADIGHKRLSGGSHYSFNGAPVSTFFSGVSSLNGCSVVIAHHSIDLQKPEVLLLSEVAYPVMFGYMTPEWWIAHRLSTGFGILIDINLK